MATKQGIPVVWELLLETDHRRATEVNKPQLTDRTEVGSQQIYSSTSKEVIKKYD